MGRRLQPLIWGTHHSWLSPELTTAGCHLHEIKPAKAVSTEWTQLQKHKAKWKKGMLGVPVGGQGTELGEYNEDSL